MPRLDLVLFGHPSVTVDGQPVQGLTLAKAEALLYYLALEPDHTAARITLADLFWPELSPAAARANLRQIVAQLKQAIPGVAMSGPLLVATPSAMHLNAAYIITLDVHVFHQHLQQAAMHDHPASQSCAVCARWRRWALALYRGAFLDGVYVHDSSCFETWAALQREAFHLAVTQALTDLATYYLGRGALRAAAVTLERLLALEPWHDDACRQLMVVYAALGQRSAAQRHYRRYAAAINAELGIEPDAETTAVYRAIGAGTSDVVAALPTRDTRFPTNLPVPLTSFVGRTTELHALCAQIRDTGDRLITITGPPGIGKSRLALAVGQALREEFDDGVWWVPLVDVRAPAVLVAAIVRAVGSSAHGEPLHWAVVHRVLRDKLVLLILDNCDQLVQAAPHLAQLLEACPNLTMVLTSRVLLHIRGEHPYLVPPLSMPEVGTQPPPAQLTQFNAIELFLARARAVRPELTLSEETAPTVTAICQHLHGLALGIELAAARTALVSLPELHAQLAHRLDALIGGARDLPRHQHTMRSAITWSYDLLHPAEQHVFRRLGSFAGGWTMDAAHAVCPGSAALVQEAMQALLDHSFIHRQPDPHNIRFGMLELLREYALEQVGAMDEDDRTRQQHADYFAALARAAAPHLKGAAQRHWIVRLEAEHDNLRLALSWSFHTDARAHAVRLVGALWWFWRLCGYFNEGRTWVARALAVAPTELLAERAELLVAAGFFAWDAGDRGEARRWFEAAVALAPGAHQSAHGADALYGLGMVDVFEHTAQAQARLEHVIACYHTHGNAWGAARALQQLTRHAIDGGRLAAAERYATESLHLARQTANPWLMAWSLMAQGHVIVEQGNAEHGAVSFAEAATLFRSCADGAGIAHASLGQAIAACARGNYARATGLLIESQQAFRAFGLEEHLVTTLVFTAFAALFQGRVERAREPVRESLRVSWRLEHGVGMCCSLIGLAWIAVLDGRPERAAELLGAEQVIHEHRGMRRHPLTTTVYTHVCTAVSVRLDPAQRTAAWARGQAWHDVMGLATTADAALPPVAPGL